MFWVVDLCASLRVFVWKKIPAIVTDVLRQILLSKKIPVIRGKGSVIRFPMFFLFLFLFFIF
jgi:hypothetical protein